MSWSRPRLTSLGTCQKSYETSFKMFAHKAFGENNKLCSVERVIDSLSSQTSFSEIRRLDLGDIIAYADLDEMTQERNCKREYYLSVTPLLHRTTSTGCRMTILSATSPNSSCVCWSLAVNSPSSRNDRGRPVSTTDPGLARSTLADAETIWVRSKVTKTYDDRIVQIWVTNDY